MSKFTREYIYTDIKGRPKLRKLRLKEALDDGRKFKMQSWSDRGHCWVGVTDRQEDFKHRALYRLPELLWALRDGEPVYWCEGEKDADALRALGVCATSHWQGAVNATEEQAAWFTKGNGESPIFLVADLDKAGAACVLWRGSLLARAGVWANRVTMLSPPATRPRVKDVAEMVAAGLGLENFREPDYPKLLRVARVYMEQRQDRARRGGSDWMSANGEFLMPEFLQLEPEPEQPTRVRKARVNRKAKA